MNGIKMNMQSRFIDFRNSKYVGSGRLGLSNNDFKRKQEVLKNSKKIHKDKLDKWKRYFDMQIIFREMSIEEKGEEAMKFIKSKIKYYMMKKHNLYIGFSGGKDSLVTLDLVRRVQEDNNFDIDIPAIYADTTLMDKTVNEYVIRLNESDSRWNIHYRLPLHNWEYFFKEIRPPSNTCRWGDKLLKNYPIIKHLRQKIKNDGWKRDKINAIIGTRADEGIKRKYYGRVDYNKFSKIFNLYPIYYFTTKDVWDYIKQRELMYCSVYDQGRSRVGCLICPMNTNGNDEDYLNGRSDLKNFKARYYGYLIQYAHKYLVGEGKEDKKWLWEKWIGGNLWRTWSSVIGKDLIRNVVCERTGNLDDGLVYKFNIEFSAKDILMFFKPFFSNKKWSRLINIDCTKGTGSNNYLQINVKYYHYGDKKLFNMFETQLIKAINCIKCGYCETKCDEITVTESKYSISDKCDGCLKCCKLGECIKWNYSNVKNVINCDRKVGTYHYQNG